MRNIILLIIPILLFSCKPEVLPTDFNVLIDAASGDNTSVVTDEDVPRIINYSITPNETSINLSVSIVGNPSNGVLSNCNNTDDLNINCLYTPNKDFNGSDRIIFQTKDGDIKSATVSYMDITVNPVQDTPVAIDNAFSTRSGIQIDILLKGIDPDGDQLEVEVISKTEELNGRIDSCIRFDNFSFKCGYISHTSFIGTDEIKFKVKDSFSTSLNTGIIKVFVGSNNPCDLASPPDYCSSVHKYKPALAVRGAACLMCHAKVDGNLVTDFGYGDSFFFGGHKSDTKVGIGKYSQGIYSNWTTSWSGAKINGNIVVPKVMVNKNLQSFVEFYNDPSVRPANQLIEELSLKEILVLPYKNTVNKLDPQKIINILQPNPQVNIDFEAAAAGVYGSVIEKEEVLIRGPSKALIESLISGSKLLKSTANAKTQVFYKNDAKGITGTEFQIKSTDHADFIGLEDSHFVEISGDLHCEGDVIIKGRVHLNNLRVINNEGSCRIYATESVYITGAPSYNTTESNLQVSSAKAIVMGFQYIEGRLPTLSRSSRYNTSATLAALKESLLDDRDIINIKRDDSRPHTKVLKLVNGVWAISGYNYKRSKTILSHYEELNGSASTDPNIVSNIQCPIHNAEANAKALAIKTGKTCYRTRHTNDVFNQQNFKQILLNAPIVYSRYFGEVKGIIIAEEALFSIGKLNYAYDPVFNYSAILPLTIDQVFKVTETPIATTK